MVDKVADFHVAMGCVRAAKQSEESSELAEKGVKVVVFDITAVELTEQVVTWVTKAEVVSPVIQSSKRAIFDEGERHGGENAVLQKPARSIKAATGTSGAPQASKAMQ